MRVVQGLPLLGLIAVLTMGNTESACSPPPSANDIQRDQQEKILQEGNSQVGMPAITNFREKKMMKQVMELRDQASFVTYTYLYSQMTGHLVPFCKSIGYPLPYATQFTGPESVQRYRVQDGNSNVVWGTMKLPQADPNGLFSPASAQGTWIMCFDPHTEKVMPQYSEPDLVTLTYRITDEKFPGEK